MIDSTKRILDLLDQEVLKEFTSCEELEKSRAEETDPIKKDRKTEAMFKSFGRIEGLIYSRDTILAHITL